MSMLGHSISREHMLAQNGTERNDGLNTLTSLMSPM